MTIDRIFKKARMIALCSFLAIAGTVLAETKDFGEIVMGTTYSFSQGDELKGTYTAPADGSYKFVFTGFEIAIYTDETYSTPVDYTFFYGENGTRNYMVPLAAGRKVYLYSSSKSTISSGTMMLAEIPTSLKMVNVSPGLEPGTDAYYGGLLSASLHYRMTFFFSERVTCTSASLRFPDGTYSPCATQISGASIQVGFSSQIMEAYKEGKLQKGDTARIRLVGVKCVDYPSLRYGSNGRLEVGFAVDAKPAELVEMVNGPTTGMADFLSYYMPGDSHGIITMEFDGELADKDRFGSYARLTYGNPEDLEHQLYIESLPIEIEGGRLSIDLTGKLRRPIDMIPGISPEAAEKYIALRIGNLYSADGQFVFTGSMSSFSSFNFGYPVKTVTYTFATDYTPGRGARVQAGTPVEIWIMNGARASFDNLKFSYVKNGEAAETLLEKSALEISADPEDPDATLIHFAMPDLGADQGSKVKVVPGNLFFADGQDHSSDMAGEYVWGTDSGVASVEVPVSADVYTTTGVCVLRNATSADIMRLPAGIYIHGGKKIKK